MLLVPATRMVPAMSTISHWRICVFLVLITCGWTSPLLCSRVMFWSGQKNTPLNEIYIWFVHKYMHIMFCTYVIFYTHIHVAMWDIRILCMMRSCSWVVSDYFTVNIVCIDKIDICPCIHKFVANAIRHYLLHLVIWTNAGNWVWSSRSLCCCFFHIDFQCLGCI